jgi:DNA modification methylase
MSADYLEFLKNKVKLAKPAGIEVPLELINPELKPHTRAMVQWAVRGGRRAIFASFGLHKTATQIETMRIIGQHIAKPTLITMPLGVRQEFKRESELRFNGDHAVNLRFIRTDSEIDDERTIYMTNYESIREGKLTPALFGATTLDEAAVLRSYGSKTFQEFMPLFNPVQYRFAATATPSPNRYKEIIHYAAFLGIMDSGQALTRFFQRDSTQANNLTLYPHKEDEFWLWVSSWALFVQKPSDLGFSDDGYDLPPLDVRYHEVSSDYAAAGADRDGQNLLFQDVALGVQSASAEKRESLGARVAKLMEIRDEDPDAHRIIWHDLETERTAIEEAIPGITTVYGSQNLDDREELIVEFSDGKYQELATKPIIAGSGCNFQRHCAWEVFLGIGFKFNDFIQAIHRVYRFQQTKTCRIDIIYTEAEREVLRTLQRKWQQHNDMVKKMTDIIRKFGLNNLAMQETLARSIGVERLEVTGEHFTVANNDCVLEAMQQPENSVGLIVTSIPFANHYEYTPSYNDFGHTENNDHFWKQMDFLTPQLLRILKPGRIYCCHVKDRINFGNVTGAGLPTSSPFHCEATMHALKHGFDYLGMITIVTDVVRENNQTYRLGYTEMCKDGSKMGVGSPEYVLIFHKPQTDRGRGYADDPIRREKSEYSLAKWQVDAHAFWRSSGNRMLTAEEMAHLGPEKLAKMYTQFSLANIYDYEFHVKIGEELHAKNALPSTFMSLAPGSHHPDVWHDVNRMHTLNGAQTNRAVEKHVCPLQFDIVDRLIERYSNAGDLVYDPFCGLGTVPVRAIKAGRRGAGSELNTSYFFDSVHYLQLAEREVSMPTLFDFEEMEAAA